MTMTLDQFIPQVRPYDQASHPLLGTVDGSGVTVDFVPELRRFVWVSAVATALSLALLMVLPSEQAVLGSGYFVVLRSAIAGTVGFFHAIAPLIVALDLIQLAGLAVVCPVTGAFTRAEIPWHWAALVLSLTGAFNGFLLSIMLGVLVLNLVLWVVVIVLCLFVAGAVLAGLASSSN